MTCRFAGAEGRVGIAVRPLRQPFQPDRGGVHLRIGERRALVAEDRWQLLFSCTGTASADV